MKHYDTHNVIWMKRGYVETLGLEKSEMAKREADFKKWLRGIWGGWLESYEPARGGGVGIPDVQLAFDQRLWPIELKLGDVKGGRLYPREVRPDQIGWHRRLADEGIVSLFLVVVYEGDRLDYVFGLDAEQIVGWKQGFDLDDVKTFRLHKAQFSRDLRSHLRVLMALTPRPWCGD